MSVQFLRVSVLHIFFLFQTTSVTNRFIYKWIRPLFLSSVILVVPTVQFMNGSVLFVDDPYLNLISPYIFLGCPSPMFFVILPSSFSFRHMYQRIRPPFFTRSRALALVSVS